VAEHGAGGGAGGEHLCDERIVSGRVGAPSELKAGDHEGSERRIGCGEEGEAVMEEGERAVEVILKQWVEGVGDKEVEEDSGGPWGGSDGIARALVCVASS
jgi:hypothetical protein